MIYIINIVFNCQEKSWEPTTEKTCCIDIKIKFFSTTLLAHLFALQTMFYHTFCLIFQFWFCNWFVCLFVNNILHRKLPKNKYFCRHYQMHFSKKFAHQCIDYPVLLHLRVYIYELHKIYFFQLPNKNLCFLFF